MEQPESTASIVDIPPAVSRRATAPFATTTNNNNHHRPSLSPQTSAPVRTTHTSNSVPTLRFPRPQGNRQLTNWVSSSQPDIMSPTNLQDDAPLSSSVADLGYEFIGTDGESQGESAMSSYDHASELADDVQSLADTDTGTDAYTNDVDTDSSDEEDDAEDHILGESNTGTAHAHEEDHESDMEIMADLSLEHPTELFAPGSAHISRPSSVSDNSHDDPILERALSAAELARERAAAKAAEQPKEKGVDAKSKTWIHRSSTGGFSLREIYEETVNRVKHDSAFRRLLQRITIGFVLLSLGYMITPSHIGLLSSKNTTISTVPVASVAPISTEIVVSTSTVTATVTSTKTTSNALQTTTSPSKSVASVPSDADLRARPPPYSASLHSRNEILLKVPPQYKSAWISKQAVMISVSRGASDISSKSTKITPVDEGFLIEVALEEAHGILDVSIATTRKPKINETFHVSFGRYMFVDAFDAGKQLMKGFAQTVVDTVNGTTAWVEETCIPAFDLISKQASLSESIMQSLRDAVSAALDIPTQLVKDAKQTLTKERVFQAETELLRQAQDVRSEVALVLLKGQLSSKLWWLKVRGQTAEYERYLAAAEPYYQKRLAEAADASRVRGEIAKKGIRAWRKQERREARRSFWKSSEGGS